MAAASQPITPEDKERLRVHRVRIVDSLNIDDNFCDHIIETALLNEREMEDITIEPRRSRRVGILLDFLKRKSQWHYEIFLQCLRATGNEHIVQILYGVVL